MASTLVRFESSGFLPMGIRKTPWYAVPVDNEEFDSIVDVCETIHNYPGIFERMRWYMM
jgi:hypothetical protein